MDLRDWKRFKRSGGYRRKETKRFARLVKPGSSGTISLSSNNKSSASSENTGEYNEGSVMNNILPPRAHNLESEEVDNIVEEYDSNLEKTTEYEKKCDLQILYFFVRSIVLKEKTKIFVQKKYEEHHKYDTPLLQLNNDMVENFPVADS